MQQLSYLPFERLDVPPPVDRATFIVEHCRGRRVLDLGCYDETAAAKRGTQHWLHGEIVRVAETVLGVDNSAHLPDEGLVTGTNSRIVRGDVTNLDSLVAHETIDTIVAGELLEHLPNPVEFLRKLKAGFSGRELLLSTPNSTSLSNGLLGLFARESNHCDHLQIFSYKTLNTLCLRAGFSNWKLVPYQVRFTELSLRMSGFRRLLVNAAEQGVNLAERAFPLLSGGFVLHVDRI